MADGVADDRAIPIQHLAAIGKKLAALRQNGEIFGMVGVRSVCDRMDLLEVDRLHRPPERHSPSSSSPSTVQDTSLATAIAAGRRLGFEAATRMMAKPCSEGATILTSREGSFSSSSARASSSCRCVITTSSSSPRIAARSVTAKKTPLVLEWSDRDRNDWPGWAVIRAGPSSRLKAQAAM